MEGKGGILMQQYELGRMLGQGTFAKVYYARNVKTGQSVAIKVIDKDKISRAGMVDQIKREISVMRLVRHPNIIHLHEVMATKTKIYFVIEYARGGELFDKVVKGRLKDEAAWRYFQQLIDAVDFCHSRGVYHRDLKPENLLLDENGVLKVSDFGLSALAESKRQDGMLHTMCGTPAYVAPEVIGRKGYDGVKADIWSCGVILYVLLAGYLPFHDSNLMEMYRKIGKAEFKCPNWFAPEVRKLLVRMMDPNPSMRVSIVKIKENPWFKRGWFKERKAKANGNCESNIITACADMEMGEDTNCVQLNAFDVISLSGGFNLSGLFEDNAERREVRFTSRKAATVIISKLEELGKRMKMRTGKKDRGLLKMEALEEGRKGKVGIEVEIFEVTEMVYLVEVKKSNGDTLEYEKLLREDIRPGLQDIVWVWQGMNLQLEENKTKQEKETEHRHDKQQETDIEETTAEEIQRHGSSSSSSSSRRSR